MRSVKPSTKAISTSFILLIAAFCSDVFLDRTVLAGFFMSLAVFTGAVSWICEVIERGQE